MDDFDRIPADLTDADARLRASRPVADAAALDRVLTRAQRARSSRRSSLASAFSLRAHRRKLVVAVATMGAVVGTTGVAAAVAGLKPAAVLNAITLQSGSPSNHSGGLQLTPNAGNRQYCPGLVGLQAKLNALTAALNVELGRRPRNAAATAALRLQIAAVRAQIEICIGLGAATP